MHLSNQQETIQPGDFSIRDDKPSDEEHFDPKKPSPVDEDPFGNEQGASVKYHIMKWW